MKISKVKIKLENNDGTCDEVSTIMPNEIAERIRYGIITWKDDWVATTNTVENYKKEEKEFIKNLKNQ